MPYRILSHTADTGIEAIAATFPELVAELATAMFALMASVDSDAGGERVVSSIEGVTAEDLVVDTLSELIYRFEVGDVVFHDISVAESATGLDITAIPAPLAETQVIGPAIKAVTYHDLVVEERNDGWFGRVYFDV